MNRETKHTDDLQRCNHCMAVFDADLTACPKCGADDALMCPFEATRHTPGPWDSGGTLEIVAGKWGEDVPTVAIACCDLPRGLDGYANARLIAAAPELLKALAEVTRRLADWMEIADREDVREADKTALRTARAAIAKAKGGTP